MNECADLVLEASRLRDENAELRAEIERLQERLKGSDMLAHVRGEQIERLRVLVKDLADDLEGELRGHYGPVMDYPSEKRRFERDMANVYEARRALEGK